MLLKHFINEKYQTHFFLTIIYDKKILIKYKYINDIFDNYSFKLIIQSILR